MRIIFTSILIILVLTKAINQNAQEIAKKCLPSTVSILMSCDNLESEFIGSGFLIDENRIITNYHVIEKCRNGYVILNGENRKHKIGQILKVDEVNDLALLYVPSIIGVPLQLKSDKDPEIGEKIYAIGNPMDLSGTISEGIVSGIRQTSKRKLIQITAPISHGSSGGAVLNNYGQIVGVAVGGIDSGQNLNFAIPAVYIENLLNINEFEINESESNYSSNTGYIRGQNVNVRSLPTIEATILYRLNENDRCDIINKTKKLDHIIGLEPNYWYQIKKNGAVGWVFGKYINGEQSIENYTKAIVQSDGVFIRLEPNQNSLVMGMAYTNDQYEILDRTVSKYHIQNLGTYHWFKIKNKKNEGWIFGKFLNIY